MNPTPENHDLLHDVFAEATPADFSAAVLSASIRAARYRRRLRRMRRTAIVVGAIVVTVVGSRPFFHRPDRAMDAGTSYRVVRTIVLPPKTIVHTQPLVSSSTKVEFAPVAVVHTRPGTFRMIGDEALLALAGPKPALLVETGPNHKTLILPDSLPLN